LGPCALRWDERDVPPGRRHYVYIKATAGLGSQFQPKCREPKQASTLRDLAFFVLRVLAARVAELLDLELLGLRALVLVGDVVVALAVLTGELDEVSHLGGSSERVTLRGCAALKRKRQPSPLPEKVRGV
jgi:hypothetical protein